MQVSAHEDESEREHFCLDLHPGDSGYMPTIDWDTRVVQPIYYRHWASHHHWPWEVITTDGQSDDERIGVPLRTSRNIPKAVLTEQLRPSFDKYAGEDHSLSVEELPDLMRAHGHPITDAELQNMMQAYDDDGSGELDFDEFVAMVSGSMSSYCCCLSVTKAGRMTIATFHMGLQIQNTLPRDLKITIEGVDDETDDALAPSPSCTYCLRPGQAMSVPNWDTNCKALLKILDYEGLESEAVVVYNARDSFTNRADLASVVSLVEGESALPESPKQHSRHGRSHGITSGMTTNISYPEKASASGFSITIGSTHWVVNHTASDLQAMPTGPGVKDTDYAVPASGDDFAPIPVSCASGKLMIGLASESGTAWSSVVDVSAPGLADSLIDIESPQGGHRYFVVAVEAGAEPYSHVTIVRIMSQLLMTNNTDHVLQVKDAATEFGHSLTLDPRSTVPIFQHFRQGDAPFVMQIGICDPSKRGKITLQTSTFDVLQKSKPFWLELEHFENRKAAKVRKAKTNSAEGLHIRRVRTGDRATVIVRSTNQVAPPYRLVNRTARLAHYRLLFGSQSEMRSRVTERLTHVFERLSLQKKRPLSATEMQLVLDQMGEETDASELPHARHRRTFDNIADWFAESGGWISFDTETHIRDSQFCALDEHMVEVKIRNQVQRYSLDKVQPLPAWAVAGYNLANVGDDGQSSGNGRSTTKSPGKGATSAKIELVHVQVIIYRGSQALVLGNSLTTLGDKGSLFHCKLELSQIGISILDNAPEELLHISLTGINLAYIQHVSKQTAVFLLQNFQVDDMKAGTVVLAPKPNQDVAEPWMRLVLELNETVGRIGEVQNIFFRLKPMVVQLEWKLLELLVGFQDDITTVMSSKPDGRAVLEQYNTEAQLAGASEPDDDMSLSWFYVHAMFVDAVEAIVSVDMRTNQADSHTASALGLTPQMMSMMRSFGVDDMRNIQLRIGAYNDGHMIDTSDQLMNTLINHVCSSMAKNFLR